MYVDKSGRIDASLKINSHLWGVDWVERKQIIRFFKKYFLVWFFSGMYYIYN